MKKLLTIAALIAGTALGFSQGIIVMQNTSAGFAVSTNSAIWGSGQSGVSVATVSTANLYYYALLAQTYTGTLTTNDATLGTWTLAEYATNAVTGGMKAPGGSSGTGVSPWTAPTDAGYTSGSREYYMIVGWSANLGSTWAAVQAQLDSNTWTPSSGLGYFGVSALANTYAGGGPSSLPAVSVWGAGAGTGSSTGIPSGFQLYQVPVPEPTTMALAGLGGLSLLLFRRRK